MAANKSITADHYPLPTVYGRVVGYHESQAYSTHCGANSHLTDCPEGHKSQFLQWEASFSSVHCTLQCGTILELNDTAVMCSLYREAAEKALNATGQDHINMETLYQASTH